jgi:hypothetical protein
VSDPGDTRTQRDPADEPFLERWSRRKREAREGIDEEVEVEAAAEPAQDEPAPAEAAPGGTPALPELPDIDSLGEDSDYSAFMAPGVDGSLRRKALRKLFSSPKFNVCDGLDDYCEDFTQWAPLGDVITADMRHHLERAAKLAEQLGETAAPGEDAAPVEDAASGEDATQAPPSQAAVAAPDPLQEAPETDSPAEEPERDA